MEMVQAVKNNPWNTIDLMESLLEQLRAKEESLRVTTQIEEPASSFVSSHCETQL